jgi:hypothetical protein
MDAKLFQKTVIDNQLIIIKFLEELLIKTDNNTSGIDNLKFNKDDLLQIRDDVKDINVKFDIHGTLHQKNVESVNSVNSGNSGSSSDNTINTTNGIVNISDSINQPVKKKQTAPEFLKTMWVYNEEKVKDLFGVEFIDNILIEKKVEIDTANKKKTFEERKKAVGKIIYESIKDDKKLIEQLKSYQKQVMLNDEKNASVSLTQI